MTETEEKLRHITSYNCILGETTYSSDARTVGTPLLRRVTRYIPGFEYLTFHSSLLEVDLGTAIITTLTFELAVMYRVSWVMP